MEPTNGSDDDDDGGAFEVKWDKENTIMSSLSIGAVVLAIVLSIIIVIVFTISPRTRVLVLECSNPRPKKSNQQRRAAFIKAETERCSTKLGDYHTPSTSDGTTTTA